MRRLVCLVVFALALSSCEIRETDTCDGTGRLNLIVGSNKYHVADENLRGIGFWNHIQPPSILKPQSYKQPNYCRSKRMGKGPVYVKDFSVKLGGSNGLLLKIRSTHGLIDELVPKWPPVRSDTVGSITYGKGERVKHRYRLPINFRLKGGGVVEGSVQCLPSPDPEDDQENPFLTICRINLPLEDGNLVQVHSGGVRANSPDKMTEEILRGLQFAEELQKSSEEVFASGPWP